MDREGDQISTSKQNRIRKRKEKKRKEKKAKSKTGLLCKGSKGCKGCMVWGVLHQPGISSQSNLVWMEVPAKALVE
jgi:hypothetical protein